MIFHNFEIFIFLSYNLHGRVMFIQAERDRPQLWRGCRIQAQPT